MNVIEVYQSLFDSLFPNEEQALNEYLIELATFFYKVDKRVSLEEQKYMEDLMSNMEWESNISIEAFQADCIARINEKLSNTDEVIREYLSNLMVSIDKLDGAQRAKKIARQLIDADGEIADDEVKYFEIVTSY